VGSSPLLKAGERYNVNVPSHALSFNPIPLAVVVLAVLVVLFVLLARRRM